MLLGRCGPSNLAGLSLDTILAGFIRSRSVAKWTCDLKVLDESNVELKSVYAMVRGIESKFIITYHK